jgi:hypothetical protein
MVDNPP